jgi:hypothetical protein
MDCSEICAQLEHLSLDNKEEIRLFFRRELENIFSEFGCEFTQEHSNSYNSLFDSGAKCHDSRQLTNSFRSYCLFIRRLFHRSSTKC